jgi:hypothetical protein
MIIYKGVVNESEICVGLVLCCVFTKSLLVMLELSSTRIKLKFVGHNDFNCVKHFQQLPLIITNVSSIFQTNT